jgi:hypothetical protein
VVVEPPLRQDRATSKHYWVQLDYERKDILREYNRDKQFYVIRSRSGASKAQGFPKKKKNLKKFKILPLIFIF